LAGGGLRLKRSSSVSLRLLLVSGRFSLHLLAQLLNLLLLVVHELVQISDLLL